MITHEENKTILDLKIKLAQTEFELDKLKIDNHVLQYEKDVLRYENEVLKIGGLNAQSPAIDKDMLKTLIVLCHPDKHKNSPGSEKAMKFLLKLREKK
jgi:hypothetical protein